MEELALKSWKHALLLEPRYYKSLMCMAWSFKKSNKKDKAKKMYFKAAMVNKESCQALVYLADILCIEKSFNVALEMAKKAV